MSNSVEKRIQLMKEKSEKARESANKRWENEKDTNAMRTHSECNAMKRNEIKEKEIKEINITQSNKNSTKRDNVKPIKLQVVWEEDGERHEGETEYLTHLTEEEAIVDAFFEDSLAKFPNRKIITVNGIEPMPF